MKKGFTLVELSIVLVIIGLLIGGILVGQSMISTAKLTKFVRQMQQYDIAVANFKNNYRQFPGDSNLFAPTGNNNRDYTDIIVTLPSCNIATCREMYAFWKHLSDSAMLNDGISYTNDQTAGTTNNAAKLENDFGTKITLGYSVDDSDPMLAMGKFYVLGYAANPSYTQKSPVTLITYDSKVDDGNAATGKVKVYNVTASRTCLVSDTHCMATAAMMISMGEVEPAY